MLSVISYHMSACMLSCFSCVWFFETLWTVVCQAPLSMGFSRHEYWSGLPFPPPGDLPNPGIEPESLMSPVLAAGFFTTSATWKAYNVITNRYNLWEVIWLEFFSFLFVIWLEFLRVIKMSITLALLIQLLGIYWQEKIQDKEGPFCTCFPWLRMGKLPGIYLPDGLLGSHQKDNYKGQMGKVWNNHSQI